MAVVDENTAGGNESQIRVKVSDDRLEVFLSCGNSVVSAADFAAQLQSQLDKRKITAALEMETIDKAKAQAMASGGDINGLVIARGKAPVLPQDGRLEWLGEFFTEGYYIDPITRKIDFHQKVENRSVEKGQLLVRIIAHQEGSAGVDVYGLPIKPSRAKKVDLRGGPHVVWDGEEKGYRANSAGRVKYVGDLLDVDEVMHIRGDINNETGNIKHNGQLIVDGNVEPDYRVEASGDIEIRGLIFASDVECGGNLTAREGINEHISKKISVKGNIIAKYILNATIECGGNVIVKKEIFQSSIKSCGEINCSEGRIVGGEMIAARGVVAGEVGSKGNVRTSLVVGVDYSLLNVLKQQTDDTEKCKEVIRKLTPVYKKLKASMAALTAAQKESLTEINFRIVEAEEEMKLLDEKGKEVRKKIFSNRDAQIRILNMVYPGALLRVADTQKDIAESLLGPIEVRQDKISRQITLSSELTKKDGVVS